MRTTRCIIGGVARGSPRYTALPARTSSSLLRTTTLTGFELSFGGWGRVTNIFTHAYECDDPWFVFGSCDQNPRRNFVTPTSPTKQTYQLLTFWVFALLLSFCIFFEGLFSLVVFCGPFSLFTAFFSPFFPLGKKKEK